MADEIFKIRRKPVSFGTLLKSEAVPIVSAAIISLFVKDYLNFIYKLEIAAIAYIVVKGMIGLNRLIRQKKSNTNSNAETENEYSLFKYDPAKMLFDGSNQPDKSVIQVEKAARPTQKIVPIIPIEEPAVKVEKQKSQSPIKIQQVVALKGPNRQVLQVIDKKGIRQSLSTFIANAETDDGQSNS